MLLNISETTELPLFATMTRYCIKGLTPMSIEPTSTTYYDLSKLPATERSVVQDLIERLPKDSDQASLANSTADLSITAFVDGRNLSCPMPLLKTKVALRQVVDGDSLYVVATDPNSQADIVAFCEQSQMTNATSSLSLAVNTTSEIKPDSNLATSFDTIYHFIITKTDSN